MEEETRKLTAPAVIKKLLSIMLAFVMLCSITAGVDLSAYAGGDAVLSTYKNFKYYDSDNRNVIICGYDGKDDKIAIPSKINNKTVVGIEWDYENSNLVSVTIPSTIKTISTFHGCNKLSEIKVDKNNKVFDSRNNCNGVIETRTNTLIVGCKNTIIPNGVTGIDDFAFYGCIGLKSIIIPNSVTRIGNQAFYSCTNLTNITMPNSVTSIGADAFENTGYYNNKSNWENGVLYIGKYLVASNENTVPNRVTIKNGTVLVADWAFYGCYSLESIIIPSSVTSIGNDVFLYCESLNSIKYNGTITLKQQDTHTKPPLRKPPQAKTEAV